MNITVVCFVNLLYYLIFVFLDYRSAWIFCPGFTDTILASVKMARRKLELYGGGLTTISFWNSITIALQGRLRDFLPWALQGFFFLVRLEGK